MVEVSADEITLRVGSRWLHFTSSSVQANDAAPTSFRLKEDGTVCVAEEPAEEMDVVAERFARELLA